MILEYDDSIGLALDNLKTVEDFKGREQDIELVEEAMEHAYAIVGRRGIEKDLLVERLQRTLGYDVWALSSAVWDMVEGGVLKFRDGKVYRA